MSIPNRVRDILEANGQAAAEVPCAVEDCREFVSVWMAGSASIPNLERRYPYLSKSDRIYRVCRFRVRSELIRNDVNVSPDDLWDYQSLYISGAKILVQVLSMWLENLELLGRPADCDIPI